MKYPTYKTISIGIIAVALLLMLILGVVKIRMDKNAAALCKSVHPGQAGICPVHRENSSWLIILAFGVSVVVLAMGIFLYALPPPLQAPKKVDVAKLGEDEKQVYQLLSAHDGAMYQSDLIKETGFSKVRMSRLVDKMTLKGILEKKRRGMTNLVVLK